MRRASALARTLCGGGKAGGDKVRDCLCKVPYRLSAPAKRGDQRPPAPPAPALDAFHSRTRAHDASEKFAKLLSSIRRTSLAFLPRVKKARNTKRSFALTAASTA